MMYGVFCSELTFFESPTEPEVPAESPSLTTGIVKVTRGEVSEAQIVQRLRELAPGEFQWDLVGLADKMFRVECPSVEDLQRLLIFGMCWVDLEFDYFVRWFKRGGLRSFVEYHVVPVHRGAQRS